MRLYLAHPATYRHQVRDWELMFEARSGIDLINPFYDGEEAEHIKPLDEGRVTMEQYCNDPINKRFPAYDIRLINDPKTDGTLAICPPLNFEGEELPAVMMIGTPHEMFATAQANKPLYVVTGGLKNHLWFQYDNAKVFSSVEEFENYMLPLRIAFIGRMGDGKTTAAKYLVDRYDFTKYSFADKLKSICAEMYPDKFANGAKPRELLQFIGTDAFRRFDKEVWVNYLVRKIKTEGKRRVVVDDCRFENEAQALRELGFYIVRLENTSGGRYAAGITRPGVQQHSSELELEKIHPDKVVRSNSLMELYANLGNLLEDLLIE